VFDEVDAATLEHADPAILADPVEAIRRTNRANLSFWAEANVRDPGAPVTPQTDGGHARHRPPTSSAAPCGS
jgi:hypothetical protein